MSSRTEELVRVNMITGVDETSGQNVQDPRTSRKLQSWIPRDTGELHRELPKPRFPSDFGGVPLGVICALYPYYHVNDDGSTTRFFFAAARLTPSSETCKLYVTDGSSAGWSWVAEVGTLNHPPGFAVLGNMLHLVDGVNNWMFDGTSWITEGIMLPWQGGQFTDGASKGQQDVNVAGNELTVAINVVAGGTFSPAVGRYYWFTNADHSLTRPFHESSSSAIGKSTAAQTSKKIAIYQSPGLWTVTAGSPRVDTQASTDNPGPTRFMGYQSGDFGFPYPWVLRAIQGKTLYINGQRIGTFTGDVFTAVDGTHGLLLTANSPATIANGRAVIVDDRCTHWHIYASESDASKIGQFLSVTDNVDPSQATFGIPVTRNLAAAPVYDQSPYISDPTNKFLPIFRPVRNDPPPASRWITAHKTRLWRRREKIPYFFNFTANEEVRSGANGSFLESIPGASTRYPTGPFVSDTEENTLSDLVNEAQFPVQAVALRGAISHSDALYFGSEKQIFPLYGESLDDFILSQVTAFNIGFAGRNSQVSTPHGLVIVSTDPKVFLYPSYGVPLDRNATDLLQEIGYPIRSRLAQIDRANLDRIVTEFFFAGNRNWLILTFPIGSIDANISAAISYETWAYDFSTQGWFQLAGPITGITGYSFISVFEFAEGKQALIGGGNDGIVYVIDDPSHSYVKALAAPVTQTVSLATATLPPGTVSFPAGNYYVRIAYLRDGIEWTAAEAGPLNCGAPSKPIIATFSDADVIADRWRIYFGVTAGDENNFVDFTQEQFQQMAGIFTIIANGKSVLNLPTQDDLPTATWRTALIDFGDPANSHLFSMLEMEFTNSTLQEAITVNYWLDPENVDFPGAPRTLVLRKVLIGANYYRGFPDEGTTCRRLLLEVVGVQGQRPGGIRGAKLQSYKVRGLLK